MSAGYALGIPAIAQIVFDGVIAHFDASSVTLPSTRYIAPGATREVAWPNCESYLVTCGGIAWGVGPGQGGGTGRQTGNAVSTMLRHTIITIQIVRCVDNPDQEPDAERLTAAGLMILKDAGLLSQAMTELCGRNGPLARYGSALPGTVEIIGPSGMYTATEGQIDITAPYIARG
jgi:hypothetical protein